MATIRTRERQEDASGDQDRAGGAAPGKRTRTEAIQAKPGSGERAAMTPAEDREAAAPDQTADAFDFSFARPLGQPIMHRVDMAGTTHTLIADPSEAQVEIHSIPRWLQAAFDRAAAWVRSAREQPQPDPELQPLLEVDLEAMREDVAAVDGLNRQRAAATPSVARAVEARIRLIFTAVAGFFERVATYWGVDEPPADLEAPDAPAPQVQEPPALATAADHVKTLQAERARSLAAPPVDQARIDELDRQVEEALTATRDQLEVVVRRVHPTLERVDRARNLYQIQLDGRPYSGTLESLLDFVAPSPHLLELARLTASHGGPGVTPTLGLAGSGAQGRVARSPSDIDFGENIQVAAADAGGAAQALAVTLQRTVREAGQVPGQRLPMIFIMLWAGKYPSDHPGAAGTHAKWTRDEVLTGRIEYLTAAAEPRALTLAQALACDESAFIDWRGPVDAQGTYGEITKMIRYEAVDEETGARFFGTPEMGQAQQEVSFGRGALHDQQRRTLLARLAPQVAEYAAQGDWTKAVKRAYTVARSQNDLAAVDDLGPLLGGDEAQRGQAVAQLGNFVDEVVTPGGVTSAAVPEDAARDAARSLTHKVTAVDDGLGASFALAIDDAEHLCANAGLATTLTDDVLEPLRGAADPDFAVRAGTALRAHGYLSDEAI